MGLPGIVRPDSRLPHARQIGHRRGQLLRRDLLRRARGEKPQPGCRAAEFADCARAPTVHNLPHQNGETAAPADRRPLQYECRCPDRRRWRGLAAAPAPTIGSLSSEERSRRLSSLQRWARWGRDGIISVEQLEPIHWSHWHPQQLRRQRSFVGGQAGRQHRIRMSSAPVPAPCAGHGIDHNHSD